MLIARHQDTKVRDLAPRKELKKQGREEVECQLSQQIIDRTSWCDIELEKQPELKMVSNGKIPIHLGLTRVRLCRSSASGEFRMIQLS